MSLHSHYSDSETISLCSLNDTCLAVLVLTRPVLKPTIYCTQGKHVNHYTSDVVHYIMKIKPKYNSKTIGRYKPDKSMVKLVHPPTPPQTDLAFIYNNNICSPVST